MSKSLLLFAILIVCLAGGCGSGSTEDALGGNQAGEQIDLFPEDRPVGGRVGNLAPDFNLERLEGGQLVLSSLRGKTVLIDFWDTWCPPCKAAMPHLQELSEKYSDDLVVVGVAFGKNGPSAVKSFVQTHQLTFEFVLADPQLTIVNDFGGIASIPTTYIVNSNGVITHKWVGAKSKETYEQGIRKTIGL